MKGVFIDRVISVAFFPRRSLAAQHEARIKEALAQAKSMQSTMALGKQALQVSYICSLMKLIQNASFIKLFSYSWKSFEIYCNYLLNLSLHNRRSNR